MRTCCDINSLKFHPPKTLNVALHLNVADREGLETSILGLEFVARHKHFKRGNMKLKCLATIATVYLVSNEESVEGERPQKASVLESRGTAAPASGSRADRVQGKRTTLTIYLIHRTYTSSWWNLSAKAVEQVEFDSSQMRYVNFGLFVIFIQGGSGCSNVSETIGPSILVSTKFFVPINNLVTFILSPGRNPTLKS